jgi:hypothetical protein
MNHAGLVESVAAATGLSRAAAALQAGEGLPWCATASRQPGSPLHSLQER